MTATKQNLFWLKLFGLFSVVRGYNILIIVIAQYLASIFILASEKSTRSIILDYKLFLIIFCSSLAIASGYIINNFYDSKKDSINKPIRSSLNKLVSQESRLHFYFILNISCCLISWFVSWKATLFFGFYIFLIWLYSHKIKRILIAGNLTAATLAIFPFFGIFLYFRSLYEVVFYHAAFLFLLILIRELVKDLENIKGDFANGYQTIPAVYSVNTSKKVISILTLLSFIPVFLLIESHTTGLMNYYFYTSGGLLLLFLVLVFNAQSEKDFWLLHILLKLIIVAGVFSILLINPDVILKSRIIYLFH